MCYYTDDVIFSVNTSLFTHQSFWDWTAGASIAPVPLYGHEMAEEEEEEEEEYLPSNYAGTALLHGSSHTLQMWS